MKWIRRAGVYVVLLGLLALLPRAVTLESSPPSGLAAKKYQGYSGVLKMWVCEGWQSGSGTLCGWLDSCLSSFEKGHDGVYVQLTQVSREVLSTFAAAQSVPPDLLVFSPGMLESAQCLLPLSAEYPVREELASVGRVGDQVYALPIALGGYCLAFNRQMMQALPQDWSLLSPPEIRGKTGYLLNVPRDDEGHSWSAALIALFSGRYAHQQAQQVRTGEGMDLGLPTPTPAAQQTPAPVLLENSLPASLPEDFRQQESVYSSFTRGEIAALPATQRELRRLELLSESGKAPDYAAGVCGQAFTDQVALIAVTTLQRPDREARQALCEALIAHLLSPEMQGKLTSARAFAAIDCAPLYGGSSAMAALENSLSGALLTPPAFGDGWREGASILADRMQRGEISPTEAYALLQSLLKNAAGSQV